MQQILTLLENSKIAAPHFFSGWRRTPAGFEVRPHAADWPLRHRKPVVELHTGIGIHEILGGRLRFRFCYTLHQPDSFRGGWLLGKERNFARCTPSLGSR